MRDAGRKAAPVIVPMPALRHDTTFDRELAGTVEALDGLLSEDSLVYVRHTTELSSGG